MKTKYCLLILLLLSFGLASCHGHSKNQTAPTHTSPHTPPTSDPSSAFQRTTQWDIRPQQGKAYCFDLINEAPNDCTQEWDVKFVMKERSPALFTNSGASGKGKGGALGGPFDYTWKALKGFSSGMVDNKGEHLVAAAYLEDAMNNAFAGNNTIGSQILEYGVSGHLLLPNYSVILVTTDGSSETLDNAYAVQITGYYGGSSGTESGYPTLRWAKVGSQSGEERSETINASSDQWVYFDLNNGSLVDAPTDTNWHLAFHRYQVKTNSGISGKGKVGTFLAAVPKGFYDQKGHPILGAFTDPNATANTLPLLFDPSTWNTPKKASDWKSDTIRSSLNPMYRAEVGPEQGPKGMKMQLNYGWYRYFSGIEGHTDHTLTALPENGVMLRARDGATFARMHLINIEYQDPKKADSPTTWTFELDIAPK